VDGRLPMRPATTAIRRRRSEARAPSEKVTDRSRTGVKTRR
jgi:hypothetical protein